MLCFSSFGFVLYGLLFQVSGVGCVVFGVCFALANAQINIQKIHAKVQPQMESKSISGTVLATFTSVKNADTLVFDAKNMQVKEVIFQQKNLTSRFRRQENQRPNVVFLGETKRRL